LKVSQWFKGKPVNIVNQEWHEDGSVTVKIYREGWRRSYSFRVKDLGKATEQILEDEEVEEED